MKLNWFLLLILSATVAHAETIPLPASVPGVDDIISEFRTQIVTKIVDLGKNYISTINKNTLVFTNSEAMKCNEVDTPAGERLASIQYNYTLKDKQLVEQVVYFGCNSQISLVEDVITEGEKLTPLSFKDIIKGNRTVELQDGETKRIYKLSNGEGDEIFSVIVEKGNSTQTMVFNILQQKFLTINFRYSSESTRAVLTYSGYDASYTRKHGRWGMRNRMESFNASVLAKKDGSILYFNNEGNLVSLSTFMGTFNHVVMDTTVSTLSQIFEYHTFYFPKTESTKTGNQGQRFIDELRLAQNRLLANTDLNLVKLLVQDLINAAELGQIIDNRPKKN